MPAKPLEEQIQDLQSESQSDGTTNSGVEPDPYYSDPYYDDVYLDGRRDLRQDRREVKHHQRAGHHGGRR